MVTKRKESRLAQPQAVPCFASTGPPITVNAPSTLLIIFNLSTMMKLFMSLLLLLQASFASAKVVSLTVDNIVEKTEGKTIFVKFFAPWCETCQDMAINFLNLSIDWEDHDIGLVAEVDCDGIDSEKICDDFEILELPTILYGDRTNLYKYQGDRTYKAMSKFAKQHISNPSCSMEHMENCSKKKLAELQEK
jgi:thiol-disulfide isomerase/thioredoxin